MMRTDLSRYDGKYVRVTDTDGNSFTGYADCCSAEYCFHEYGTEENGVLVEDPHQFVSTQTVRTVRPGVWYVMPEQFMDHFSFMGGILTESQQTVRNFYDGVIENIVRCGG